MLAQHAVVARRLLAGFLKRDPGILSRPFPTHMFAFGQILLLESADDEEFHSIDFHQIYLDIHKSTSTGSEKVCLTNASSTSSDYNL